VLKSVLVAFNVCIVELVLKLVVKELDTVALVAKVVEVPYVVVVALLVP
tara:strand:- start:745 stop:891 length:147 start_codon:yes stop_codon:yes gene_type:complete